MNRRLRRGRAKARATREMFEKAQAAFRAASDKRRALSIELAVKYGSGNERWASRGEKTRLDKLMAAQSRAGDRVMKILDAVSPRNWHSGVPWHWVNEELTWEDAVRPIDQPLSVTPPLAFGASQPMR